MTATPANPHEEPINTTLKHHVERVEDWEHHDLAGLLHGWTKRFNQCFSLQIPIPVIQLDNLRKGRLGQFRHGRGASGLKYEIILNTKYIKRPLACLLMVLLHELIHLWEELYGKPGQNNYHTAKFRNKAGMLGIVCSDRGHDLGFIPDSPFVKLLAEQDIEVAGLMSSSVPGEELPLFQIDFPEETESGTSTLTKWSCQCCNIRAPVEFNAVCLNCEAPFQKSPPTW